MVRNLSRSFLAVCLAALAALAIGGCVYKTANGEPIADPGALPYGNGYLITSTGGSTLPLHTITQDELKNPDSTRVRSAGQMFTAGQLNGTWVDTSCGSPCGLWAPEIKQYAANYFVAYFTARSKTEPVYTSGSEKGLHPQCIGMATATSPTGGFSLYGTPFCNPQHDYNLIDPTVFQDGSTNYLLFKRDVFHGQDTGANPKSIAMTKLGAFGLNPTLPTTVMLTPNKSWETAGNWSSVEAPTMIRRGNYYWLFYSGNLFSSDRYGVGVARCPTSLSPLSCNKDSSQGFNQNKNPNNPILTALYDNNYCGAGHQDVTDGGNLLWYHTYTNNSCTGGRSLGATTLEWDSAWPTADGGGGP